jgi:hypothetical protein
MNKFAVIVIILASLALAYWFLLRPVLRQRADLAAFFNSSDMLRAGWLAKLKLSVAGLRTVLFAKFVIIAGLLIPVLDIIGAIDLTSILPSVNLTSAWQITPTQYVPAVVLPLIGWINLELRKITTTPVGVPSAEQVATIMPDATAAVVEQKTAEIAEAKAPPSAASGKD